MYSCYARRISFEINSNSKEIRRAEHEYMNKHPPINVLVTSMLLSLLLKPLRRREDSSYIEQWRSQPESLVMLCKFFCVYRL